MKAVVSLIVALFACAGWNALAAETCGNGTALSCSASYELADGTTSSGPQSVGHFQSSNDGEGDGVTFCGAYVQLISPSTNMSFDASLSPDGNLSIAISDQQSLNLRISSALQAGKPFSIHTSPKGPSLQIIDGTKRVLGTTYTCSLVQ